LIPPNFTPIVPAATPATEANGRSTTSTWTRIGPRHWRVLLPEARERERQALRDARAAFHDVSIGFFMTYEVLEDMRRREGAGGFDCTETEPRSFAWAGSWNGPRRELS
jgi:hypothetical protein